MTKRQFSKVPGYIGIYTRQTETKQPNGTKKPDLSFYARLQQNGKAKNVFIGRKSDAMTPAKAAQARARLIDGLPITTPKTARKGKAKPGDSSAADDYTSDQSQPADHWTYNQLWEKYVEYMGGINGYSNYSSDRGRYDAHLRALVGEKRPVDMTKLFVSTVRNTLKNKTYIRQGIKVNLSATRKKLRDTEREKNATRKKAAKARAAVKIDRLKADIAAIKKRADASRKKLSTSTIECIIELLRRLANFGEKNNLCPGPPEKIKVNRVNNEKTEDLTPEQIAALWAACDADQNQEVADMIKLMILTGLRRGSVFALAWQNVNFQKDIITIKSIEQQGRHSKGGHQFPIPLNPVAKQILERRALVADLKLSPYVFPGKTGGIRNGTPKAARRICKAAGLPDNFRPFHGQRHAFATNLINTGVVDLSQISQLLAHSPNSPNLTRRYAHIRDQALKNASNLMSDIVTGALTGGHQEKEEKDAG